MRLQDRLKQNRFASPAQEAMLNVLVTSAWLNGELSAALGAFDVTPAQYNVLRILRGSHPEAMTCSAIGERLLDRTPDVTRLLDRLERSDLLCRKRCSEDRRVVKVSITDAGLALLEKLDPSMQGMLERLAEVMSEAEFHTLSALLEKMRSLETVPVAA